MNVIRKSSLDKWKSIAVKKPATVVWMWVNQELKKHQNKVTKVMDHKNQNNKSKSVDEAILNSQYFTLVNNVYRDVHNHLIEYGIDPSKEETEILENNLHKYKLISWLETNKRFTKFSQFTLQKIIIKHISSELPYVDQVGFRQKIDLPNNTYSGILLDLQSEKKKKLELKESLERFKMRKEADVLFEALNPIKKRLENVTRFTVWLSNGEDIKAANKQLGTDECRNISMKNKEEIESIFTKLFKDKENLSELEKDKVIILKLEQEIVVAAKKSFEAFIRHICTLYKDKFTLAEHNSFRNLLIERVNNSEDLENFRLKLFKRLVQLQIRKVKEKQKNYWLQKKKR